MENKNKPQREDLISFVDPMESLIREETLLKICLGHTRHNPSEIITLLKTLRGE